MNATRLPTDPALVQLATIGAPHGVRGEVRLKSFTSDPMALGDYGPLRTADGRSFSIIALRPAKDVVVARFEGIVSRSEVEALKGLSLYVPRDRLPSPDEDEFYHIDLIGLDVLDEGGVSLGRVVAVHDFGGGEMLDLKLKSGASVLIPFTRVAVPVVDIAGRCVRVDRLAAGLVDEDEDTRKADAQ